jgi:hypothetical protein
LFRRRWDDGNEKWPGATGNGDIPSVLMRISNVPASPVAINVLYAYDEEKGDIAISFQYPEKERKGT